MSGRPRTVSLASDDRARIPFALLAVLLLVSSIAIVAVLESRDRPEVDVDQGLAVDRAESIATGEIRHAVVRATDDAAKEPVSSTDGADTAFADAVDSDDVFEQYLALRIYRDVAVSLASAEQEIGHDRTAVASVERLDWDDGDDLESAIDRIDLEQTDDDVLTATVEDVELTVEHDGEETVSERRDITVSVGTNALELRDRTSEFEEQLETGFFEADEFYDGFGRYFAARMYPYVWGKAYYDRLVSNDRTFHNLTPNEHTEVMANDAVFALQEASFGTADPYEHHATFLPTICMANDLASEAGDIDLDELLGEQLEDEINESDGLCESDFIDTEGEIDYPEPPTIQEIVLTLLEDNVDTDVEIQAHPFADIAYMELVAGLAMDDVESEFNDSLEGHERFSGVYLEDYFADEPANQDAADAIDGLGEQLADLEELIDETAPMSDLTDDSMESVYDVEIDTSETGPTKHDQLPETERPGENWSRIDRSYTTSGGDASVSIDVVSDDGAGFDDRELTEVELAYETDVGVIETWRHDNETFLDPITNVTVPLEQVRTDWKRPVTYSASYEIDADLAENIDVERERGLESPFGTDSWNESYGFVGNFDGIETDAAGETFDLDATSVGAQERELEDEIEGSSRSIVTESDLERAIPYSSDPDVDVEPRDRTLLYDWVIGELNRTHEAVVTSVAPHETNLWSMLEQPSPLGEVEDNVRSVENELVYENTTGSYENTADLLRAEVRKQYFEAIYEHIETVESYHEETIDGGAGMIDDLLGGLLDAGNDLLGAPLEFVESMLDPESQPEDARAPAPDSELLEATSYQVEASPTYLSLEPVNRSDVPAVRPEGGTLLEADPTSEHASMGAGYFNAVGFPGLPLLPVPSLSFLQLDVYSLEVQGEYARFEVRANSGDPAASDETTYVRQDTRVSLETPPWADQDELAVGSVEPIGFENRLVVPVVVPSPQLLPRGTPGVGDMWQSTTLDVPREECSTAWNDVGASFEPDEQGESDECISDETELELPVGG
ncbi:DUF7286 family protein [Natronorubrum texcoconense]|uniref:Uncharacterized protein n=1 Tax=Natronorubrum texcoconense TaxID=1095776 RepID=A0A1G9FP96_9EURY|nr:hypothetical protein [Natronorubrum texcoconense]SDK90234.1 hypothetical protein SAMN04515672_4225 [Natronorubrum texcoconense]